MYNEAVEGYNILSTFAFIRSVYRRDIHLNLYVFTVIAGLEFHPYLSFYWVGQKTVLISSLYLSTDWETYV